MSKYEKRIIDFIIKYRNQLFFVIISALAVLIRLSGKDFISNDMKYCLIPWYDQIKASGGLKALGAQVGDYNLLYQTIISIMTYLKINCIYCYKALSILFDYILAFSTATLCTKLMDRKKYGFLFQTVYAIVLFLPTVFLDSAFWGQCDSIYTTFIVLTLLFMYEEKYVLSFVMLGLGISFKLQTAFILPFIICYYIYKKKFSIFNLLISLIVFWSSGIVTYFMGRSVIEPFKIYFSQADTYKSMYLNINSFWAICTNGNNYENLKTAALLITLAICGIGLFFIISGKIKIENPEDFITVASWFIWVCLIFLPAMHERYTYPLDILLIVASVINRKYLKFAFVSVVFSFVTYGNFLLGNNNAVTMWTASIYLFTWAYFTYTIYKNNQERLDTEELVESDNIIQPAVLKNKFIL